MLATLVTEEAFLTAEQHMKILADQAMFSEIMSAKRDAVDQLAEKYGIKAIPTIQELIESNSHPFDSFRLYCVKTAEKIFKKMEQDIVSQNV